MGGKILLLLLIGSLFCNAWARDVKESDKLKEKKTFWGWKGFGWGGYGGWSGGVGYGGGYGGGGYGGGYGGGGSGGGYGGGGGGYGGKKETAAKGSP